MLLQALRGVLAVDAQLDFRGLGPPAERMVGLGGAGSETHRQAKHRGQDQALSMQDQRHRGMLGQRHGGILGQRHRHARVWGTAGQQQAGQQHAGEPRR